MVHPNTHTLASIPGRSFGKRFKEENERIKIFARTRPRNDASLYTFDTSNRGRSFRFFRTRHASTIPKHNNIMPGVLKRLTKEKKIRVYAMHDPKYYTTILGVCTRVCVCVYLTEKFSPYREKKRQQSSVSDRFDTVAVGHIGKT